MNFKALQQAIRNYDEITVIGRNVEQEGKRYHMAGVTRQGSKASLYVLAEVCSDRTLIASDAANRERMKAAPESDFFMEIAAMQTGETELLTKGITGYYLGNGIDCDCEELLLFAELIKAGWELPDDSVFSYRNWEELQVIHIDFELSGQRLPRFENQKIVLKTGKSSRNYLIEKPVELTVGGEAEIPFALKDGRSGICYVNRVYLMDVWKENEERFKDPRYLEIVTEEELAKCKEEFFQCLEEACPRGMYYIGIEYECTLDGNLVFYDRDFLETVPETRSGSARIMMMLLKPDEPLGKHGLTQHGCVIQTPVAADVHRIEAELFYYVERMGERKVEVSC